MTQVRRLEGVVQHYAWGSLDALPTLLGRAPDGTPWAELWLGDHPAAPSTLPDAGGQPLHADLPFLLKLLAAGAPLSLQAHPSREQATAGYDREDAAGIALDAPGRTYRDRNHKPELLCALTPFRALCGFREPAASAATLRALDVDALAPLIAHLDGDALDDAMRWLLSQPSGAARAIADAVASSPTLDDWSLRIAREHPGDIGVVTALLLNRIELAPGDGLFLGPGTLHAYLEGLGVELMASSDNVVRGGLTPKHVDTAELLRILLMVPSEPTIVRPHAVDAVTDTWPTPAPEFRLWRITATDAPHDVRTISPEVLVCLHGRARVDGVTLEQGEAAYVPRELDAYSISGPAVVYRATSAPR